MGFKLYPLILGATALWLNSVNGQQYLVPPGYNYYNYPSQSYFYTTSPKQCVKIITMDPSISEYQRMLNVYQFRNVVNPELLPYFQNDDITPDTPIQVQASEARTSGDVGTPFYPILRPPSITNIRPSTLVYSGPYGVNALRIGGIGRLGPTLLGRESENYQIGRSQTRSTNNGCSTFSECNDVSSSSSIKNTAQVGDLHQISIRDNNNDGKWREGNSQNINYRNEFEISDAFVNRVQGEIQNVLRDMSQDRSKSTGNSSITIDAAKLRKILQNFVPTTPYISGTERQDLSENRRNKNLEKENQDSKSHETCSATSLQNDRQSATSLQPSAPMPANDGNNGWNSMNGDPNSQNYYSWWTNSYPYNGKPGNPSVNYPSTNNNGQFGNPTFNYPTASNNGQSGNPTFNYPTANNNGQSGNPFFNYPTASNNGQPGNHVLNYPPANNGQPGKPGFTYPPINSNGQFENPNYNSRPMNTSGPAGNPNYNPPPMNNGRPGVSFPNGPSMNPGGPIFTNPYAQNYNPPPMNNGRPGVSFPNGPSTNPGGPVFINPYAQNNADGGFNSPLHNNYENSANFPYQNPEGYPINGGNHRVPYPNPGQQAGNQNMKYSQSQSNFNGNFVPMYTPYPNPAYYNGYFSPYYLYSRLL